MIIVSQDKDKLINFSQMEILKISEGCYDDMMNYHDRFSIESCTSTRCFLGEYETEERAKEVLQEIEEQYEHIQYLKCLGNPRDIYQAGINDFIYKMPEE